MNRLLYALLISAITIAGFTMYKQNDLGRISFSFAEFSFETNLVVFGTALLCAAFLFLLVVKSIQGIIAFFIYLDNKRKQHFREKARHSLSQGLINYAEGKFKKSEKVLLQYIKYSEDPFMVYLTAARVAQKLDAHDRRDEYLRLAHKNMPNADLAVSLTKAELQLAHNQNEQALATLTKLNEKSANHSYVLTLLANTYKYLQDWDNLKKLLPQLKKHGNMSEESLLSFEINVCNGQLTNLAKACKTNNSGAEPLVQLWKETSQHLKQLPDVTEHYTKQLVYLGATAEAENELRLYLDKHWHESSIILYSELNLAVDNKHLEMVENWLKDHQHNAYLLLALGKMCISLTLWGKARSYLEASVSIQAMPENYLILARLLEENMDDPVAAQEYYRQGLHLLAGHYGEEILDHSFKSETPQLKIVKP
jgi:HemY protein